MLAATTIDIFVAGRTGEEVLTLQIDGVDVQSWTEIGGDYAHGIYEQIPYTSPDTVTADQVRLVFTNDGFTAGGVDRDLRIDGISVGGQFFESEDPGVSSYGSWGGGIGCGFGFKQSEYLNCGDGYFQYTVGWSAGLFVVDTAIDEEDGDYSLGDRSLREALSLAVGSGSHRIEFDASLTGAVIELTEQLHILGNVEIVGLGSDSLTVDAKGNAASPRRAFLIDSDLAVSLSGITITGGYEDRGGAIRSEQGDLSLQQVVLQGNSATFEGGGIFQLGGTLEIQQSSIERNSAQFGGGVYAELAGNESLTVVGSSLLHNVAQHVSLDSAGGAIIVAGQPAGGATTGGEVFFFESTIAHNISQAAAGAVGTTHHTGGVLLSQVEQAEIVHTTFSNNLASSISGGLNIDDSGTVELVNATIAFNEVSGVGSGGLTISGGSAVTVANTIVAENRANGSLKDVTGQFQSASTRNLLSSGPDPGGTNNSILLVGETAGLVPLANNGGSTLTHALIPGSRAVDGGSDSRVYDDPGNTAFEDQRGYRRYINYVLGPTAGIVDIGAVELQQQIVASADFNGDSREDQVFFDPASGNLDVLTDIGNRYESSSWGKLLPPTGNANWSQFYSGDFNGDGRDDLAAYNSTSGEWTLAQSDGTQFIFHHLELGTPNDNWQLASVGDFDGDGSDELIGRTHLSGGWQVLHFDEQAGAVLENWGASFGGFTDWTLFVGDVDQDGRDDLVGRRPFVPGNWYAVISEPVANATGHFSGGIGLGKSLDPYFHAGNFTTVEFDAQFHRDFGKDPTSLDVGGPFRDVLDRFSAIYNEIELEFYDGLKKGPQATRETKTGNPWDQSALLVEDLLAAGFQAEIVTGKIRVHETEFKEWAGALETFAAATNVQYTLDPNIVLIQSDNEFVAAFRHTWVRVSLPTKTGLGWIDLDPSWKFKDRQPGIEVEFAGPRGTYDEFDYLAAPGNQLPIEYYEDLVSEYLVENGIQASLADVAYDGPIRQKVFHAIPSDDRLATATNIQPLGTFSQILANEAREYTHRVRIAIGGWHREIVVPESSLSTFTIRRDLTSFTFIVDGVSEPAVALPASSIADLVLTHMVPDESFASSNLAYAYPFSSGTNGKFYSIALNANQHSTISLDRSRKDLITAANDGITNNDINKALEYLGARYWHEVNRLAKRAGALTYSININSEVDSGVIRSDNALQLGDFGHLQTPIVPENISLNIKKDSGFLADLRYDGTAESQWFSQEADHLENDTGSALEHSIIEEVFGITSISTLRGLKDAYQGDPFFGGLPVNSVFILESVLEGTERKVYLRGEIGERADENGYIPYEEDRTNVLFSSAQELRNYFPWHKRNPTGANDALNNSAITRIWNAFTQNIEGDAIALVPWTQSYVGTSQQYWKGSAYYISKQEVSSAEATSTNDGGYLISGTTGGPPLNGGNGSGSRIARNLKVRPGANFFRNFAGDPVDILNGNMFRDELDIAMPNAGVPLDFSRHYNSQSPYNIGLGIGWTHSFSDRLLQESGVVDELTWLTSTGVRHTFTKVAGVWESPTLLLGKLAQVAGGYVYYESEGIEHHFQTVAQTQATGQENYIARLSKIIDLNGHGVEVNYPNASQDFVPSGVQDIHSVARRLDFTLASGNRITAIGKVAQNQLVGTWNYEYNSGGTLLTKATNPEQESVTFEYFTSGLTPDVISRITEPDNAYHAYEYYPNGRAFRVKEGIFDGVNYVEQSSHSFSYDLGRNLTEFVDENGNLETYIHQEDGRLVRHIYADNSRAETTWGVADGSGGIVTDTESLMRSQSDETGAITNFEYFLNETGANAFKNRRLLSTTSRHLPGETPLVTEYDYEQAATGSEPIVNLASITVAPGGNDTRTTVFLYDDHGRLEQVTNALNEVTEFDYYADNHPTSYLRGLQLSETRPGSSGGGSPRETTFAYDSAGLITAAITDNLPAGSTTYHHTGLPETLTDATGIATSSTFDTLGRQTTSTLLGDLANPADDLVSHFSYDERGRLIASIDALGRTTTWTYDRRGDVLQQTSADSSQVFSEFDEVGNRIASTDALGWTTKFVYDQRNRLVQTIRPDGAVELVRYDGNGRIAISTDALGHETRFAYDTQGSLISTTTAAGTPDEAISTNFYNPFNETIQTVDGLGNVTQFVRDKLGRITKTQVLNALDNPTPNTPTHTPVFVSTLDYDANGNVVQNTAYNVSELSAETATLLSDDPRTLSTTQPLHVQAIQVEYDVYDRPTKTIFADNTSVRTGYDDAGRIRFEYNELNRVSEQKYDEFGRLTESIVPDPDGPSNPLANPVTRFEYDAVGNRMAIIDPRGNRTHSVYDALNRNVATLDAEGGQRGLLYDAAGQLVATVDALGRATYTRFDKRGRATSIRSPHSDPGTPEQQVSETHFRYDLVGNRIEQTDPRGITTAYEYDTQNRLSRILEPEYAVQPEIVDDGDIDFRITTDTFPVESQTVGFADDSQFVTVPTSQDKATALWKFFDLEPGKYRVLATWEGRPDASTNVTATLSNAIPSLLIAGFDQSKTTDQIQRTDNGSTRGWVEIVSEIEVTAASSRKLNVTLSSEKGSNLIADAVRVERIIENSFRYNDNHNLIAEIDTFDQQTDHTYDELNRLKTTTLPDPDGTVGPLPRPLTTFNYDGYGNIISTVEDRGGQNREQVSVYDQRNRLVTEITDANVGSSEQVTTQFGYDYAGNLVHRIEAAGQAEQTVTQYRYDRLDRLISEWYHTEETVLSDWQQAEFSSYDAVGNIVSQINRVRYQDTGQTLYRSTTTEFTYDKLNRQTSITSDADGSLAATTHNRYDAVGNLVQSTDALHQRTRHVFDRQNRRTKTTSPDPDGSLTALAVSTTTFTYDAAGNLLSQTNGAGETERFGYDSRGRMVSAFDALDAETRSAYDSEDNLLRFTDPTGNQTTSTYDALNRLTSETIDLSGTTVSRLYAYDAQGNLVETTDRNGRRSTLEYDRLDRRRYERWLDGAATVINTLEWQYDALDRIVLQRDNGAIETFDYDNLGRVTAVRNYDPAATSSAQPRVEQRWSYDLLDPADADDFVRLNYSQHQIDQGLQLGQTTFVIDRLGRTSQLVDTSGSNAAKQIDFAYDQANQLTGVTRTGNNGNFTFDTNYNYDHAGRILQLSHVTLPASPFTYYSYQYDQADRITRQITDYETSVGALSQLSSNQTEDFSFDDAGQLTADADRTYAYDDNGNRLDSTIILGDHNRLATDADYTYTYDPEGNLITRTAKVGGDYTQYTWDHRNRLVALEDFDLNNVSQLALAYDYNADDQLVQRTTGANTKHYVNNSSERALTLQSDGDLQNRTLWGPGVDQLLVDEVFDASGQLEETLWAATDHLGSVNQLLDNNSTVVEHREYDSFGAIDQVFEETGAAGQLQSEIAFAGRHWDADAGLYHNRARWYEPKSGRFLGEDPAQDSSNWYAYAGNDPINFRDPTGLRAAGNPLNSILNLGGNSSYSPTSNSFLLSAISALSPASTSTTSTPQFVGTSQTRQIAGDGGTRSFDLPFNSTVNDISGGSPATNFSVDTASSSNTLSISPAQQLSSALRASERQQTGTLHQQLVGADLDGIVQARKSQFQRVAAEGEQFADVGTSFTPLVSDIRDAVEFTTGRNVITGEELSNFQQILTGVGLALPLVSASVIRKLAGVGDVASDFARNTRQLDILAPDELRSLQLQEINAGRRTGSVPASAITPRNAHLAGQRHPVTGVPFDQQGFPDFAGVSKKDVSVVQTGDRRIDFSAANSSAGFTQTPEGFIWHHHQDGRTMQLVPERVHEKTGHTGGVAIIKQRNK